MKYIDAEPITWGPAPVSARMIQICGANADCKGHAFRRSGGVAPCQQIINVPHIRLTSGSGVVGPDQKPCFDGKDAGRGRALGLYCAHAISSQRFASSSRAQDPCVQKSVFRRGKMCLVCNYIMCNSKTANGSCPQTLCSLHLAPRLSIASSKSTPPLLPFPPT